jgi:hypothetical protein
VRASDGRELGGCLGGGVILLMIGIVLNEWMGDYNKIGWAIIATLYAGVLLYSVISARRQERDRSLKYEELRKQIIAAPCTHGVMGANQQRTLCAECMADYRRSLPPPPKSRQVLLQEWASAARLPAYLSNMHPIGFEALVADLYEARGYSVTRTQATRDGGIDVIIERNGKRTAVQCKRVKGGVGEPILRDLLGAMTAGKFDEGIVVTTGSVSGAARTWITQSPLPIHVIELVQLRLMLHESIGEDKVVPNTFQIDNYETPAHLQGCPTCGKPLRTVKGPYGKFLGCTGYPTCTYRRKAPKRKR